MAELLLSGENGFFDKVFEENLKDRKILINNEIDQDIIETAVLQIMKFNKEDKNLSPENRKPIFLYLNSVGGDVLTGLSLASIIKMSKTPIIGVTLGYGYSMGCILFALCHKRYMFEYASLLIHDGNMVLSGSAGKVKDLQNFYGQIDEEIKSIVVNNSKITKEEYEENSDRELYLMAEQCKEKGLCDGIVGIDVDLDEIL